MKYTGIVLSFIFCAATWLAQAQRVRTGKNQPHALFVGVENNLDWILDRYDTSVIDVRNKAFDVAGFSASSGDLSYNYTLATLRWTSCEITEDSVTIEVYDKRTQKTIGLVTLKEYSLPSPSIIIPKSSHKLFWGRKDLFENKVSAAYSAPGFKFKCEIVSFGIQLQKQGAMLKEYENKGAEYTEEAISLMRQFEVADTAYFSNFEVRCGCETNTRVLEDRLQFVRVGEIIKVDRMQ